MSEKKARQNRQQARKVIVEYTIRAYNNNDVEIIGPFQNFLMFREIMNRAEMAAIKSIIQSQKSKIIVPDIKIPSNIIN